MPNSARNASVIAPLAAENRGFSKKRTSSIGLEHLSSHTKNPTRIAPPTAKPPRTVVEPQPLLGPSMMAHSRIARPAIDRSDPSGSSLTRVRVLRVGDEQVARDERDARRRGRSRGTPIPTRSAAAARRPRSARPRCRWRTRPAHTPMALARSRGSWNTLVRIDSVAGMIADAPMPISARVPMRTVADGANADSAEPMPKIDQADGERAVATEAVTEAAGREQQAGEHDGVRVDDPLQLAGRGAESARARRLRQRRDGDVEDRVVDPDHHQAQAQDEQGQPTPAVRDRGIGEAPEHRVPPCRVGRGQCNTRRGRPETNLAPRPTRTGSQPCWCHDLGPHCCATGAGSGLGRADVSALTSSRRWRPRLWRTSGSATCDLRGPGRPRRVPSSPRTFPS